MKVHEVEQGSDEWHAFRKGKISGTRVGELYSARAYTKADLMAALEDEGIEFKKSAPVKELKELMTDDVEADLMRNAPKKIGFYEVLAERIAEDPDDENRMDRGLRLEEEAIGEFNKVYPDKRVERVGVCVSDVDPRIINSPDGLIAEDYKLKEPKYTEAVEIKCLSSARHLQAVIENRVPDEYETQKIQYFVVNPSLKTLYFCFYDPRIPSVPFHIVTVTREELGKLPDIFMKYQIAQLKEIDEWVEKLAF